MTTRPFTCRHERFALKVPFVISRGTKTHADVVVADPHVDPTRSHAARQAEIVELSAEEVDRADAVIILVDHDDFDLELVRNHPLVLDTRRCIEGPGVEVL